VPPTLKKIPPPMAVRCADCEINKQMLSAIQIEDIVAMCQRPLNGAHGCSSTYMHLWCVYATEGCSMWLACVPLKTSPVLLARSYLSPRKTFESSTSYNKFVKCGPVVHPQWWKHVAQNIEFHASRCFWQNFEISWAAQPDHPSQVHF